MFLQLYKYRLKRLIKDKVQLFWLAVFPLVLGTLFYMAFSEISSSTETLKKIPVAILKTEEYPNKAALELFLEAMTGKDGVLKQIPAEDYKEAENLLMTGEIDAIWIISDKVRLEFAESGMNQTILKHILSRYLQGEQVLMEAAEQGSIKALAAAAAFSKGIENEEFPISSSNMDPYVHYFFALMAMTCMYGASLGMLNTQEIQADQTKVAARRCISPVKKGLSVLTDFLAAFTVQIGIFLLLYAYLALGLKLDFGTQFGYILLAGAAACFNGISFGYLLGISIKVKSAVKDAIMTGTVLFLCFLSGLMIGNLKYWIENNVPIINRINPAALISNSFYYICVFDNKSRYWDNIFLLLLETLLFGILSAFVLKREKYKSI